ncbi:MAG: glycosyltransferase family 2 protein [Thermoplasmatales archaeon]|nr:glycosyltransferase family 2 protein [Thermoplasmatales archaeon]MCW6170416.1 glycosyltransferase family 2 protein [Thermoplasmatales archaeon]
MPNTNDIIKRIFISVIVTAHDRKSYLRMAVDSVRNQTLDKEFFEIIVLKNFEDDYIDSIHEENFVVVNMEGTIGEYLSTGIKKSKGDIICFLDDDDEFYPNKLQKVSDVFNAHPNLGYYHNGFKIIDGKGKPLKKHFGYKQPKQDISVYEQEDKEKYLFKLGRFQGTFNLSCVSVRRSILPPDSTLLKSLPATTDGAIYIIALKSNMGLLITKEIFNRYRIHGDQSITLNYNQWSAVNKKMLEASALFCYFLKETKFEKYGEWSNFYWSMRYRISEGWPGIRWGDVLNSFRYYVLTGQVSSLSLMIILIVLKIFRVSLIDIKYR